MWHHSTLPRGHGCRRCSTIREKPQEICEQSQSHQRLCPRPTGDQAKSCRQEKRHRFRW
jgi:hypothetical protein